ncbi:MAG TPA: type II toxin-antitoxin system RelE/ParE family toxin [Planctomycetota bacterium]|nr:type II toxin-antitoxin system RelE/ParE family toxin [Planctomycetota bacterium]
MTVSLCFAPGAEDDLAAIFTWYEAQRQGLGARFLDAEATLFERMRESPKLFPEVVVGFRRALLRNFPFGVYFSLEPTRVVGHAVLHLYRDPAVWRRRLSGNAG